MSKRDISLYVEDINACCGKIIKYTKNLTFEEFQKDSKTREAVERNLEIIGEAAGKLTAKFKKEHKNIPWAKIVAMRNKVIHEYFGVDAGILWKTVKENIPALKKEISKLQRARKKQTLFV